MKELLHILNSNRVMKNGLQFTVGALTDGIWQGSETGFPTLVSHDQSRVIGWTVPLALHIEPGLARSVSLTSLIEDSDEAKTINQYKQTFDSKLIIQKQDIISELKDSLSEYLNGNERIVHYPQVALFESELAARVFPKLFSLTDKDGLIPLSELNPIGAGVFQIDKFVVFAHEYFRRALFRLNTLNAEFLSEFQNVNTELGPKIAIDRDMVGLAEDYFPPVELMYVWGPSFTDDLTKIKPGVTVHQANTDMEVFFSGILRTEFWWKSKPSYKEFEVEEIVDHDHPHYRGEKQFGCRYSHSMIDSNTGVANHLDGSVRMYSEEKMIERLDANINKAGKHSLYTKLWRVDGNIDIVTWKSLVSSYFRENTLIGEYLGGVDNNPYLPVPLNETETQLVLNPKYNYVPYSMKSGDGLRLSISYHHIDSTSLNRNLTHDFRSYDYLQNGQGKINVLDSRVIDFHKLLIQAGAKMQPLDEFTIVKFKDGYVNFPVVIHAGDNLQENVRLTQELFNLILDNWHTKEIDNVLAFSLGITIENRIIFVSIMGHLKDLWKWSKSSISNIPTDKNDLDKWAEKVTEYLEKEYTPSNDRPPLENTLKRTGLLAIQRTHAHRLDYEYSEDEIGLRIKFNTKSISKQALQLMEQDQLFLSSGFILESMICTHCESEYTRCSCISLTSDNVTRRIAKYSPLPPHWTDKHDY